MLLNSSGNEKLFAKSVPVSIKDAYTNQLRTSQLFMTIEWQDASAAMYHKKVLAISLTDNNDPFFLYNLHLSEEDFQMLKASQDLLIYFSSFPQHIIDYIEMCLLEMKNPHPKFILIFAVNEQLGNVASPSQLDIVETNQFKHLTHLSLKFVAATESTVRQYLISCFKNLKDEKHQLQNKLSFLERDLTDKLSSCKQTLHGTVQELELLKKEMNVELNMKDSKYARELQHERDLLLNKQKEEAARFEKERREKEDSFHKEIQLLEAKVGILETLNKELQNKNSKQESTIRELRSNVLSLENGTRRLKENVQSYKHKCNDLHLEVRGKQSLADQQEKKITELEHDVHNKEQSLMRLKEQMGKDSKQKRLVEEKLEKVKLQFEMSEKSVKNLENDKLTLNEIILKLQQKVKEGTEKLETKNDFSTKQEQKLSEKEKLLQDFKKETAELNILLDSRNAKVKSLTVNVSTLQKRIDALEKDLKTKDNVITWLNRQLTDCCVVPQYTPPSNLGPSPSTIAQKQLARISSSAVCKSACHDFSPGTLLTTSNSVSKVQSQRKETPSQSQRRINSTPRLQATNATDSAYCTSPSAYDITPHNQLKDLALDHAELDPSALSAAFGSGDNVLKHSTAKKKTNSSNVKTGVSKFSKRR